MLTCYLRDCFNMNMGQGKGFSEITQETGYKHEPFFLRSVITKGFKK